MLCVARAQCSRYLHAVVVRLSSIVCTLSICDRAIIDGTETHEAMLKRTLSLFVPLEMANHLLLFYEHLRHRKQKNILEFFDILTIVSVFRNRGGVRAGRDIF